MTPLRQRMLEDMQLRGFSARTQECYASAVRQLAEHYHRSPDHLTEEDLRQYFLYLANEKRVARATATIALCAIRFFFEQTPRREWTTLRFVRPAREHKLPVVLSREEVRRVLAAVRIPVYCVGQTGGHSRGLLSLGCVLICWQSLRKTWAASQSPITIALSRCGAVHYNERFQIIRRSAWPRL